MAKRRPAGRHIVRKSIDGAGISVKYVPARKRKKKRRIGSGWFILAALILIVAGVVIFINAKRNAESTDVTDLKHYYYLSMDPGTNRLAAADDEMAIVLETSILSTRAIVRDGHAYIPCELVRKFIDDRYYYDSNEAKLIVTNAQEIICASNGESSYTVNGEEKSADCAVILSRGGTAYVADVFLEKYSNSTCSMYSDPARVVVNYKTGDISFCDAKRDMYVHTTESIKSSVIGSVESGAKMRVIDNEDIEEGWVEIVSEDGLLGYVKASGCSDVYTENITPTYKEYEYTSLSTGSTLKLGWHGVYSEGGNYIEDILDTASGLNVYAPTWYDIMDADATMRVLSSSNSVSLCHSRGILVWGLLSDAEVNSDITAAVLNTTSLRNKVEDTVINDVLAIGADGINIDLEHVSSACSEGFIQFIRELSVRCRELGLYLTCANYAPYDYNAAYRIEDQAVLCDYIMVMTYDDYLGTGNIGPNSSLPFIKEVTELSLNKVPAKKLVSGLPFYSRFWYKEPDGRITRDEFNMTRAWAAVESSGTEWDDELGLDYAEYTDSEGNRVYAWLESSASFEAKLGFLEDYGLAGYAFWQLGMESSRTWDVINEY